MRQHVLRPRARAHNVSAALMLRDKVVRWNVASRDAELDRLVMGRLGTEYLVMDGISGSVSLVDRVESVYAVGGKQAIRSDIFPTKVLAITYLTDGIPGPARGKDESRSSVRGIPSQDLGRCLHARQARRRCSAA